MTTPSWKREGRRAKVSSDGGGLNSWTMLLRAEARGELPDWVVHIDVGNPDDDTIPGEWDSTMRHIEETVRPWCAARGIPFSLVTTKDYPVRGAPSLFEWWEGDRGPGKERANRQIPVVKKSARVCTLAAKVERFERWLDDHFPGEEVEVWIGYEAGEESRMEGDPNSGTDRTPGPTEAVRFNRFPLIEEAICRCRCERIARASGYPVPRKSACVACPFGSKGDWQTLAAERPGLFAKVAELEALKPETGNGKKLSIMGYSTDKLTASACRALVSLDANPEAKVHGGTRKALLTRKLVERVEGGGPNAGKVGHLLTPAGMAAMAGGTGFAVGYKAPPLPEFIEGAYAPKTKPCDVCGASQRATKATGCSYLSPEEYVEVEPGFVPLGALTREAA